MRAEAGRPITVRVTFDDADGDPLVVTDVSYTVTDGAGVTTAPVAATSTEDGKVWIATLDARAQLDDLKVTFTGTAGGHTDTLSVDVTVVAERLVALHELREAIREQASEYYDQAPVDGTLLRRAADAAEDWLDDALGFPCVRRPVRARFRSPGGPFLRPKGLVRPGDLYELTVAGTAVDVADAEVFDRFAWERSTGAAWPAGIASLWATHGVAAPPADLRRAGLVLARYLARTSKVPERAVSMVTESTQIIFSRPDERRSTGLPEVDTVITRRRIAALI